MSLGLKGVEKRAAFAKLRGCLEEGLEDDDLTLRLGYDWGQIQELKQAFFEHEAEGIRKRSTEQAYAEYVIEQRRCMKDLDKVIDDYKDGKNLQAFVGAVRAKSGIIDQMVKTGQEFGLIERKTPGQISVAGQAIFQMTKVELKQLIIAEQSSLQSVLERYGDQAIGDLDPGPLHLPLSTPKTPVKAHARTTVHKGRRVVKGDGGVAK